jgi:protein-L-isoaspartate(D-aspartate) O-methyltransferase
VATQDDLVETLRLDGIRDDRVLAAFAAVPRAEFVPAELRDRAYADFPLPIPHDQVTTQPSLVARMLEALSLEGSERVLEIGTGYGFQTALLARLAAHVFSVDRFPEFVAAARASLERLAISNVELVVGDGSQGLPEHAPFDAIVVSAAFPRVPPPLEEQLVAGGRLVQPIGRGGNEDVILFEREPEGLAARRTVTGAHFVRLVGQHGFES